MRLVCRSVSRSRRRIGAAATAAAVGREPFDIAADQQQQQHERSRGVGVSIDRQRESVDFTAIGDDECDEEAGADDDCIPRPLVRCALAPLDSGTFAIVWNMMRCVER